MANVLSVPHFRQESDGYCLPACAQMVLSYLGVVRSQADLARQLGARPNIGTPHSHLTRLTSPELEGSSHRAKSKTCSARVCCFASLRLRSGQALRLRYAPLRTLAIPPHRDATQ